MRPTLCTRAENLLSNAGIRWLLVAAVTVLAGIIRFIHLGAPALWTDEAFSLWMAQHSAPSIWRWTTLLDVHPPLYYVLLHYWLAFGTRAMPLRAFSAIMGTLTVPLAYLLGRTIGGARLGLLTALLLTLSPFNVWYGQEARMYPLLMLAATGSLLGLALLLRNPSPRGSWSIYIAGTVVALWTEHSAVLLLLTANLIVIVLSRPLNLTRAFALRWIAAQGAILVLWSPVLPMLLHQLVAGEAGPTSLDGWRVVASLLPDAVSPISAARSGPPISERLAAAALGLCVAIPLIARGLLASNKDTRWMSFLGLVWVVPIACGGLAGLVWRPVLTPATLTAGYRTLIWTSLAPHLLSAKGLLTLRRRAVQIGALLLLLGSNFVGLGMYYRTIPKWEAWDRAAAYVAQRAVVGDVILFDDNLVQLPFDYYFRRYAKPIVEHGVPADFPDNGIREPRTSVADLSGLRALIRGHRRVWLVYSHEWWTDPRQIVPAALADSGEVVDKQVFAGLPAIRVYLFREWVSRQ